jgi:DNA-directed RNA polymerase subunit RPC12/RpoP
MYTVTCRKCNKKVPTNEVRLQADKTYMCFSCAGFQGHKENQPFGRSEEAPVKAAGAEQKIRYHCAKCKYEFSRTKAVSKCPYCNSDRIEEKVGMAQKLIDLHAPMRDE